MTAPSDRSSPRPPLVRYLSKCNVASRIEAQALVRSGRVSVNGQPCRDGARRIDPHADAVTLDDEPVRAPEPKSLIWLAMNKPRGIVSTTRDEKGRRTVMDLLPESRARGLAPVGRLDRASAGLLLLTNDSALAARLLEPRSHVPKCYRVKVRGRPTEATLESWRRESRVVEGVTLGPMGAEVESSGPASTWLRITLLEGKNRQIRRRVLADGHAVEHLVRVSFGPIALGRLAPGEVRRLRRDEVARLSRDCSRLPAGSPSARPPRRKRR